MRVDELFDVHLGIAATSVDVSTSYSAGMIPFLRPAASQLRTIAGWVNRSDVSDGKIFPPQSLFVSTDGEGSHTYAYVSSFEFSCNSNVSVLIPKSDMSLYEKIFYARCITMNRFKFSYGRKPKGLRFKKVILPSFDASFSEAEAPDIKALASAAFVDFEQFPDANDVITTPPNVDTVRLDTIFSITNGNGLDLAVLEVVDAADGVRYVSRRSTNNGVAAYVRQKDEHVPFQGGKLTCALSGEGGVLYTFLQKETFYTSYHIACLTPREPMTDEEMLFYASCIKANRFKYSFGRQANRTLPALMVPARSAIPAFVSGSLKRAISAIISGGVSAGAAPSRQS